MSAPGILNLTFPQGGTWKLDLTYNQNDVPVNLTSFSARMQARTSYDSTATVLNLTNGTGITLGGTAGTIAVQVAATTSAAIGAAQYVYDLEIESAGGEVTRVVEGTLLVTPEVTR